MGGGKTMERSTKTRCSSRSTLIFHRTTVVFPSSSSLIASSTTPLLPSSKCLLWSLVSPSRFCKGIIRARHIYMEPQNTQKDKFEESIVRMVLSEIKKEKVAIEFEFKRIAELEEENRQLRSELDTKNSENRALREVLEAQTTEAKSSGEEVGSCSIHNHETMGGSTPEDGDSWSSSEELVVEVRKRDRVKQAFSGIIRPVLGQTNKAKRMLFRRRSKESSMNFLRNGGLLLEKRISTFSGLSETIVTFSERELEEATDYYERERVLGEGEFGRVYKGILPDQRVVATKKSRYNGFFCDDQLLSDAVFLTELGRHKNIVKVIGCCLETEVPMSVHEFMPNGSLFRCLHIENRSSSLSWGARLRIASEIANAVAYIHSPRKSPMSFLSSFASRPIIHRDIKSRTILLDENYVAKLSTFELAMMLPRDKDVIDDLGVAGTVGYLDPEYVSTGKITTKTDVYGFGIVLAELVTGRKSVDFALQETTYIKDILSEAIEEDRVFDIVDPRLRVREEEEEQVQTVANISYKCLRRKGEDRPTMHEIATQLQRLTRTTINGTVR